MNNKKDVNCMIKNEFQCWCIYVQRLKFPLSILVIHGTHKLFKSLAKVWDTFAESR